MGENGTGLIYKAIPAIMAEIGAIGKDRTNEAQRYKFRGIDDVYNAVHPLTVKYKVFSVPTIREAVDTMETTVKGSQVHYSRMMVDYKIFAEDGSFITATIRGEGMDSGDKASNKAMAVAHKYLWVQLLNIPTESGDDPENDSHEIKGNGKVSVELAPKEDPVEAEKAVWRSKYNSLRRSKFLEQSDKDALKAEVAACGEDIRAIAKVVMKYKEMAYQLALAGGASEQFNQEIGELLDAGKL